MGVKFRCPNGHKLNVKNYLAGKKGFCPKCNSHVDIPLTSQRKGKAEREAAAVPVTSSVSAGVASLDPSTARPLTGLPVASRVDPTPATPTASLPEVPIVTPTDPIAANPDLQWHVQHPSGEKFGPASGELLKSWIQERRVLGDYLVWQEGWADWKSAAEVFPERLSQPTATNGTSGPLATSSNSLDLNLADTSPTANSTEKYSATRYVDKRRKSKLSTLVVVSFLAVAAMILMTVFFVLLLLNAN